MKAFTFLPFAIVLLSGSAWAQSVTQCGQTVSAGVLAGDLDCSAAGCAVLVEDGGSLDLAGYTITVSELCGVRCEKDCFVSGGSITGSDAVYGVHSSTKGAEVSVSNLDFAIDPHGPILVPPIMTNYCVYSAGSVVMENCTFTRCAYGAKSDKSMTVRDSEFSAVGVALSAGVNLSVENTTMTGGNNGAAANRRVEATNVTVTGNGYWGLKAKRVRSSSSTVTGNGGDPDCTPAAYGCADILSAARPALEVVDCGTSGDLDRHLNPTEKSWGFCSLD